MTLHSQNSGNLILLDVWESMLPFYEMGGMGKGTGPFYELMVRGMGKGTGRGTGRDG